MYMYMYNVLRTASYSNLFHFLPPDPPRIKTLEINELRIIRKNKRQRVEVNTTNEGKAIKKRDESKQKRRKQGITYIAQHSIDRVQTNTNIVLAPIFLNSKSKTNDRGRGVLDVPEWQLEHTCGDCLPQCEWIVHPNVVYHRRSSMLVGIPVH